jgi:hypothetical protein
MISMERISEFHKRNPKEMGVPRKWCIPETGEFKGKVFSMEKVQGFQTRGVPRKMMLEFKENIMHTFQGKGRSRESLFEFEVKDAWFLEKRMHEFPWIVGCNR